MLDEEEEPIKVKAEEIKEGGIEEKERSGLVTQSG